MSRLPVVGGDNDGWGTVLNDFLSVAHNADGTLKADAVAGSAEVLNVKDYGALGNGSANDTKHIQCKVQR